MPFKKQRFRLPVLPSAFSRPMGRGRTAETPAPSPAFAQRFLADFACTSSDCEDTCCADWTVAVDAASHARLQVALSRTAQDRGRFRSALAPPPESSEGAPLTLTAHASLRLKPDGKCTLLGDTGLCTLQEEHGEAALPDACALFPRVSLAVGERLELGASLACPEVARLALSTEDALDLVELPLGQEELLPRALVGKSVETDPEDGWQGSFGLVRDEVLRRLREEALPLRLRLSLIAELAEQLRPFHFRGSRDLNGASRPFGERRVATVIAGAREVAYERSALHDLGTLVLDGEQTLLLAATLVLERRALPHPARFAALLQSCFTSLQAEALHRTAANGAPVEQGPAGEVPLWALWASVRRRQDALQPAHGVLIDSLFRNWWLHAFLRWPFTESEHLLAHFTRLGLRASAVRLLFFAHPAIAGLADDPSAIAPAQAERLIRSTLIQVAQIFARAVEHHAQFLKAVDSSQSESGATLGRALHFANF